MRTSLRVNVSIAWSVYAAISVLTLWYPVHMACVTLVQYAICFVLNRLSFVPLRCTTCLADAALNGAQLKLTARTCTQANASAICLEKHRSRPGLAALQTGTEHVCQDIDATAPNIA